MIGSWGADPQRVLWEILGAKFYLSLLRDLSTWLVPTALKAWSVQIFLEG